MKLEGGYTGFTLSVRLSLYPRPMKLEGGVYWIHLVRPSVRLSVDDMVSGA